MLKEKLWHWPSSPADFVFNSSPTYAKKVYIILNFEYPRSVIPLDATVSINLSLSSVTDRSLSEAGTDHSLSYLVYHSTNSVLNPRVLFGRWTSWDYSEFFWRLFTFSASILTVARKSMSFFCDLSIMFPLLNAVFPFLLMHPLHLTKWKWCLRFLISNPVEVLFTYVQKG